MYFINKLNLGMFEEKIFKEKIFLDEVVGFVCQEAVNGLFVI